MSLALCFSLARSGAKVFPLFRAILMGPEAEREEKKKALYGELKAVDDYLAKQADDVGRRAVLV